MWENEIAAVRFGLKVLIPCQSQNQANTWLMEMARASSDMEPDPRHLMVRCESGGSAHFAWDDQQVRGREYHDALGPVARVVGVSAAMLSRVRLDAISAEAAGEA